MSNELIFKKLGKRFPYAFDDACVFNWGEWSHFVAEYCDTYFDKDLFNWEKDSCTVARYCPHFLKYKPKIPCKGSWGVVPL